MLAVLVTLISVLSIVATAPAKTLPDSANEIDSSNGILGKQVSASWGGYSASAGLGGGPNGGGLFANAGANGGPAAAAGIGGGSGGSGGSGSGYAGATSGGLGSSNAYGTSGGQGNGQGFFDNIFAIPIGVLQSVNKFLNTKGNSTRVVTREPHHPHPHHKPSPADTPLTFDASAGSATETSASASASAGAAGASAGYKPQAGVRPKPGPEFYDNVFDIPISALRSVNQFLNGGRR